MIKCVIFLILLFSLLGRTQEYNQFQYCSTSKDQSDASGGICVPFSKCLGAKLQYKTLNIAPTFCNSGPVDPIVCCDLTLTGRDRLLNETISAGKCYDKYLIIRDYNKFNIFFYVGGARAGPNEFPYMAAIGWRKRLGSGYEYNCGGTLIAPNFVLTAAHCTSLGGAAPEVVRTGGDSLDDASVPDIPIENIIVHPQYRRRQVYNDIALIKLKLSSEHRPACLWTSSEATQQQVQGIGYGHTEFAGKGSIYLIKVILTIFSNQECGRHYTPGPKLESGIINSQVCAGDPNKTMDSCQGDSGGPIVLKVKDNVGTEIPYVVGITSFGQGCASGTPSIYTRVTSYLGWIESIVWPSG